MKFGILYTLRNPPREGWFKPWTRYYGEALDHMLEMERLGFNSINFCEHHFDPDGYDPSPLVMMTAVAMRTSRVMIGQNILQFPYHHPVRLAEDLATIDILSNGRVTLDAGQAGFVNGVDLFGDEFRGLGINPKFRPSLMEEGLQIVRKCWTEEVFSFEGKRWHLQDVRVYPKPLQKPHPPIYAVAGSDASMERAARLGLNACAQGSVGNDPEDKSRWQDWSARWRVMLAKFGRRPEEFKTNTQGQLYVTDDPERAWSKYRERLFYMRTYRRHKGNQPYSFHFRGGPAEKPEDIPNWDKFFLTPEEAVRRLRDCWRESAPDEVLLMAGGPDVPFEDSVDFHRLFAEKVMPYLADLPESGKKP